MTSFQNTTEKTVLDEETCLFLSGISLKDYFHTGIYFHNIFQSRFVMKKVFNSKQVYFSRHIKSNHNIAKKIIEGLKKLSFTKTDLVEKI